MPNDQYDLPDDFQPLSLDEVERIEAELQDRPTFDFCPRCGEKFDVPGTCEACAQEELDEMQQDYEDERDAEDMLDHDVCPYCGSTKTMRMDTIDDDPVIWACECFTCEQSFEIVIPPSEDDDEDTKPLRPIDEDVTSSAPQPPAADDIPW